MLLETKIQQARDYARKHGLDMTRACIVVGNNQFIFTARPGATRWQEDIDFERDGGVFTAQTFAELAYKRAQSIFAEADKHITEVKYVTINN